MFQLKVLLFKSPQFPLKIQISNHSRLDKMVPDCNNLNQLEIKEKIKI